MSRKALVIIGLALVIAASGGVAIASNNDSQKPINSSSSSDGSVNSDEDLEENGYTENDDSDDIFAQNDDNDIESGDSETIPEEITSTDADPDNDDPAADPDSERQLVADFSVSQVLNHNSGDPVAPQVAFGKYYRQCYLKLYDDSTIELCLSPSTQKAETGTYSIEDDVLIAEYGADRAASYKLLYSDSGAIETVIVTSGQYIVYFS